MSRIRVTLSLVVLLMGPAALAAPPSPPPAPETQTEWYAGQMALTYAGTIGLIAASAQLDSTPMGVAAGAAFMLGAPALHIAHKNALPAVGGLALRMAFFGTAVAFMDGCFTIDLDGSEEPTSSGCSATVALMLAELIAMPVVDFAFARKTVERPAPSTSLVSFSVVPPTGSRPGMLGLVGRF